MSKITFQHIDLEVAQKDFISAMTVWIALEVFSFLLLPEIKLLPEENRHSTWFLMSVPLGVLGAILVGASSQFICLCQEYLGGNKKLLIWLGQLGGWLGLAGIGFPLAITGVELWLLVTR